MSGFLRRTLLVLLCLLVVSWGTCPCVFARMLGTSEPEPAEAPSAPCCCKQEAESGAPGSTSIPKPDECPCCSRGGALRDLPPPGSGDLLDTSLPPVLDQAPPVRVLGAALDVDAVQPARESTGPPQGNALHARPVGIVLLLS